MTITVPIKPIAQQVVVNVKITGMRQYTVRMWLTICLLRVAAFVCPLTMDVEVK